MKVWPEKYRYHVCPHCKSKKLQAVAATVIHGGNYHIESANLYRTGYICGNCQRYIDTDDIKYITDRAEMRRDVERLTAYLLGELK